MNTVLGLDVGTQSVKAVFYDFEAHAVVADASAPLQLQQEGPGVAEQRTSWWLKALQSALAKTDASIRRSVRGLAVSGQQHGFVALDASDQVLAPVKLWCDTSTAAECEEIMAALGGRDACIAATGNAIPSGFTASKVRYLRKSSPELYSRLDCILLPHDYVNLYLTGERCMEMGDASGTGFLDVRNRCWSSEVLKAMDSERDLMACLPALRTENAAVGSLRTAAAAELGLPAGISVALGGGDNMMGALGTGNVHPGRLTMSLGTSGTVYAYSNEPVVDPSGSIAAFCSSTGGWLPLLCTMNCTVSTEVMRGLLKTELPHFEAQVSAAAPGSGGVITVPFFNGERTPNLPSARGSILGLTGANMKPANLLRSALEGATFALKSGVAELARLGVPAQEIVLTGGGAKSATWRQSVADICGTPVVVLKQEEGAALGAALQALQLVEEGSDWVELTAAHLTRDEARCCSPNPATVAEYADHYKDYLTAVQAVAGVYS